MSKFVQREQLCVASHRCTDPKKSLDLSILFLENICQNPCMVQNEGSRAHPQKNMMFYFTQAKNNSNASKTLKGFQDLRTVALNK